MATPICLYCGEYLIERIGACDHHCADCCDCCTFEPIYNSDDEEDERARVRVEEGRWMPPKFYAKRSALTSADYDAALSILSGMDETIKLLAAKFDHCPRVLLVSTMLGDAKRELSEKQATVTQGQEGAA